MATITLTGEDVIKIRERTITDLCDGDVGTLEFPDDLSTTTVGKGGNSIISFNEMGRKSTLVIRVIRGSEDDKYLNSERTQYKTSRANYNVLSGEVVSQLGDGQGNTTDDVDLLKAGVISKMIPKKINTSGDTTQAIAEYTITFADSERVL